MLTELVVSFFLLVGAGFALIGSIGLARLPDFFTRLHGPTKATTLGVGGMLAASVTWFSARGDGLSLHELLVLVFLFITAPVGAHLMAKAALHLRVRSLVEPPDLFSPGPLADQELWEAGGPCAGDGLPRR